MNHQISNIARLMLSPILIVVIGMAIVCDEDQPPTIPDKPIIKQIKLGPISGLNLKIISPLNNSTVPRVNTVAGIVFGLPQEYSIRVFVNPLTVGRWYPQHPVSYNSDSTWSATAYVGNEKSQGETFYIGAIGVTEEQKKLIDQDISGKVQFIIDGPIPHSITVKRL